MKRNTLCILAVVFLSVMTLHIGFEACESYAADEYSFKFQSIYYDAHPLVKQAFTPWFKDLEEKSKGRINIQFFPPRAIVKENETFEGTEGGLVDIGTSMCGRNPGKFPLNELIELPMMFSNATAGSQITWELYETFPEWQKEFPGVKALFQWVSATAQIWTRDKPVNSLEDLKGMKIIGYTPFMLETVKALGANPLQISPMDAYLSLQRGMADGIIISYAGGKSLKLHEACKHITHCDVLVIPFYAVMNPRSYDRLPDDLRKVVDETTGRNMAAACGKAMDDGDAQDAQEMKEKGITIHTLTKEERVRWLEAVGPMKTQWLSKMKDKGYDQIDRIMGKAIELADQYK